jgi:hypothetical protein
MLDSSHSQGICQVAENTAITDAKKETFLLLVTWPPMQIKLGFVVGDTD